MPTLGICNRVRCERSDLIEGDAWCSDERETHGDEVFADDAKLWKFSQRILGGADAPFDAVFHGDHGVGAATTHHVIKCFSNVGDTDPFARLSSGHHAQRFPGEGSFRTQVAVSLTRATHPAKCSDRGPRRCQTEGAARRLR